MIRRCATGIAIAAMVLILASCRGPMGPAGPAGLDGINGADGSTGA